MIDVEKARRARAQATTKFPIRLELPLRPPGDFEQPRPVVLLLHESGEVSWEAEGFKAAETVELDGLFGPDSRES